MREWLIVVSDWDYETTDLLSRSYHSLLKLGSGKCLDHVWRVVDDLLLSHDCGHSFLIIRFYTGNVVWLSSTVDVHAWMDLSVII